MASPDRVEGRPQQQPFDRLRHVFSEHADKVIISLDDDLQNMQPPSLKGRAENLGYTVTILNMITGRFDPDSFPRPTYVVSCEPTERGTIAPEVFFVSEGGCEKIGRPPGPQDRADRLFVEKILDNTTFEE